MHSPSHAMRNDYDNSVPSHRRCSRRRSRANRQRSDGCRRPRKNLDRGDRRHAGCLHGRAQHPDRQRFAGRHSRRDRRRHRRRRLDLDRLSNRRDCRDPAERLACPGVLDPYLPPDQRLPLHGVLGGLRAGAKPAADHRAAAEGEAADWPCDVCDLRNLCTRTIGPTIGGYLTENWGWEYIFYVNAVPGAIMMGMLFFSLEAKPMKLELLREGDWAGIITMAIGLSALQTVLEEGNKDDWFGSPFIVRLAIIAAIALTLFIVVELTAKKPLLNLRILLRRNFGFGVLANFLLGVALYGSVFVLPVYVSRIQGYNSEQIGLVLAWTGLPQLVLIPLVPRLMKRFDPRIVIGIGFALFAASNFMNIYMTGDYAADQLFWPNVVRAIGQALVLTPLSAVATAGIEPENAG